MSDGKPYNKRDFIRTFNVIARHRHRYEVFRDFVMISAISLHNAVNMNDEMEQEYLQIVGQYDTGDVQGFCELLAVLVELLEPEPRDILGGLYMELDLGNNHTGQFFTPPDISLLMAQMTYGGELKEIKQPFITISEPACGAGGMVLAFVNIMLQNGYNPADKLWVQCIDVDRLAAYMCYLQLSLWNIPAEVVVGNTLTMEIREKLYTPAHNIGGWDMRLQYRRVQEMIEHSEPQLLEVDKVELITEEPKKVPIVNSPQFDFGF